MPDRLFFSTDSLPERDRFPAFCEEYVRRHTGLDFVLRDRSQFRGVIELQRVGPISIGDITLTPSDTTRSPSLVRDGDDGLLLILLKSGSLYQTQRTYDQKLEPGDAIICDCGYAGAVNVIADSRYWSLKVPRHRLASLVPRFTHFAGAKLDRDLVARRLLFGYLDGMHKIDLGLGETPDVESSRGKRAVQLYGEHIIDLIALALGAEDDAREAVERRGVGAIRRAAILREIETRAADPGLSADAIASRVGVTPRYLRMLLEQTGRSFSEHVLEKRLDRAVGLLRDCRWEGRKIAEVAFACGFGDLSYFNRAFRARYGETPSGARASARAKNCE